MNDSEMKQLLLGIGVSPMRGGRKKRSSERRRKTRQRMAKKRKAWIDKEIERRKLWVKKGQSKEDLLRQEAAKSSKGLAEKEKAEMQMMMRHLPQAPARPDREEDPAPRKVVLKEREHGMAPTPGGGNNLPGPLPPGFTGVWHGCCLGFRTMPQQHGQAQRQQGFPWYQGAPITCNNAWLKDMSL